MSPDVSKGYTWADLNAALKIEETISAIQHPLGILDGAKASKVHLAYSELRLAMRVYIESISCSDF